MLWTKWLYRYNAMTQHLHWLAMRVHQWKILSRRQISSYKPKMKEISDLHMVIEPDNSFYGWISCAISNFTIISTKSNVVWLIKEMPSWWSVLLSGYLSLLVVMKLEYSQIISCEHTSLHRTSWCYWVCPDFGGDGTRSGLVSGLGCSASPDCWAHSEKEFTKINFEGRSFYNFTGWACLDMLALWAWKWKCPKI